jgi:hypothetical protein
VIDQDHAILFGILFTLAVWCLFQGRQILSLDTKLIAADELGKQNTQRIAQLTADRDDQIEALAQSLREANARAENEETRGNFLEQHGRELFRRILDARRERDDALGKLGAMGALVREAARNGSELN